MIFISRWSLLIDMRLQMFKCPFCFFSNLISVHKVLKQGTLNLNFQLTPFKSFGLCGHFEERTRITKNNLYSFQRLCFCFSSCLLGQLNYLGASHQLWHILVVVMFYWWHQTAVHIMRFRHSQPCPNRSSSS